MSIALKNTAATLPPIETQYHDPPAKSFGTVEGDGYTSSRIILHDQWGKLRDMLGGELIVAIPGDTTIVYGKDDGPASIDAMHTLAKQLILQAERPISSEVFRWTKTGWDVVATDSEPVSEMPTH